MVGFVTITFVHSISMHRRTLMKLRNTLAITVTALVLLTASGCAVQRGQETMGAYVDDTGSPRW
jgi:hypothetical protein